MKRVPCFVKWPANNSVVRGIGMAVITTGNETVDAIGQLHLEGNVVPHKWFEHIRFGNGKPDLSAIIILSEIVYWYRPVYKKDEATGKLLGARKRFKSDLLQRSYDSFSDQFGLSKRQAKEAIVRLEELGFIKRHFRTIEANNTKLNNVLFIELLHSNVIAMTFQSYTSDIETSEVSHHNVTPMTLESQTNTEITTETTTENIKNNSRKRQKRIYEETSDEMKLVDFFISEIRRNDAHFKEPNKQSWCDEFRKIIELDKRDKREIAELIRWVQKNDFWKANVLSPKKLREKYSTLVIQMKEPPKSSSGFGRRTENVPDWFHKRDQAEHEPIPLESKSESEIDYESERQKILEKLGRS